MAGWCWTVASREIEQGANHCEGAGGLGGSKPSASGALGVSTAEAIPTSATLPARLSTAPTAAASFAGTGVPSSTMSSSSDSRASSMPSSIASSSSSKSKSSSLASLPTRSSPSSSSYSTGGPAACLRLFAFFFFVFCRPLSDLGIIFCTRTTGGSSALPFFVSPWKVPKSKPSTVSPGQRCLPMCVTTVSRSSLTPKSLARATSTSASVPWASASAE
mmetsp:Transcript_26509/g.84359  ORF Transcript_26509/g.84359 Transcript_26509/m.84359 type:complete len:218 (-) Transcript_26509:248-901(-)